MQSNKDLIDIFNIELEGVKNFPKGEAGSTSSAASTRKPVDGLYIATCSQVSIGRRVALML